MHLAIIIVHYHTPELLVQAVQALIADAVAQTFDIEIIVIDNGSTVEEREIIRQLPVRYFRADKNLGYAGGVNLGVSKTDAEHFILMNPDVKVLPGCLGKLVSLLNEGAAAAGPRFYWDHEKRFQMSPLPDKNMRVEIFRRTAVLGPRFAYRVREQRRKHDRKHWLADQPIKSYQLVGALLAINRQAWNCIGPFDDQFQLYFEEVDWLLRLKRRGLPAYYVPSAEAVHLFNQSASQEPLVHQWYAESRDRFEKLHYGRLFATVLRLTTRVGHWLGSDRRQQAGLPIQAGPPVVGLTFPDQVAQAPLWIEIASDLMGYQNVSMRLHETEENRWRFPQEVWQYLDAGQYVLQVVDSAGSELTTFQFTK